MFPKKIIRAAVALSVLFLLTACSPTHKMTFDKERDAYTDKKTGVTYRALPASFEPVSRGEEYGSVTISGVGYTLYEIVGQSPEKYLCGEYGDVYCEQSVTVLPFDEWTPTALSVCLRDTIGSVVLKVSDTDLLSSLHRAYRDGAALPRPIEDPRQAYVLRFTSENVPGIAFCVRYYEYADDVTDVVTGTDGTETEINYGKYFIYDLYENRCVAVDDTLHGLLGDGN